MTNAEQQDISMGMLRYETVLVSVSSPELTVEGALKFWLHRRVKVVA